MYGTVVGLARATRGVRHPTIQAASGVVQVRTRYFHVTRLAL